MIEQNLSYSTYETGIIIKEHALECGQEKPGYECIKRGLDILFSLLGLVMVLPIIIFFGILIKLESPGPAIYKQKRIGLKGRLFTIYKLRSMYIDAEKSGAKWAEKDDPRVTKIGRFFRKARIDELPQIYNILKGDMSIVGPRPERPEFTFQFEKEIPGFINRILVKPGLTGLAQVNGGYDIGPDIKYMFDMKYIKNRNIRLDFVIILKTLKIIFSGHGAR